MKVNELDHLGLVVPVAYSGIVNAGCNQRHWLSVQPDVTSIFRQIRKEDVVDQYNYQKDTSRYFETLCQKMTKVCDGLDRDSSAAIYVLARTKLCRCEYRKVPIHVIRSCLLNHEGQIMCKKQNLELELHKLHKEHVQAQRNVQELDMAMVANLRSVRTWAGMAGAPCVCPCMDISLNTALWETNYKSYP